MFFHFLTVEKGAQSISQTYNIFSCLTKYHWDIIEDLPI